MTKPALLIATVATIGIVAVTSVSAEDAKDYGPLVTKIASHFNLNPEEVEKVIVESREEHHADMVADWETRLSELVAKGEITEAQKQAILTKQQELHDKVAALEDLSPSERKEQMDGLHEELKAWADTQGIDLPTFGLFGRGFKKGFSAGYWAGSH